MRKYSKAQEAYMLAKAHHKIRQELIALTMKLAV
jgi:hypothetical protein